MAFCKNCGTQLDENANFCPSCGAAQSPVPPAEPIVEQPAQAPAPQKASGILNVGQLVWSIINLVACCTPLGLAALIITILAKDAPTAEEESKKLKTAKTCNLIGTIGSAVIVILYIVFFVVLTAVGVSSAM